MKQPRCPIHGFGRHLVNAGAPFLVRCAHNGGCGVVLERCTQCRNGPTTSYCGHCERSGWQVRTEPLYSAPII